MVGGPGGGGSRACVFFCRTDGVDLDFFRVSDGVDPATKRDDEYTRGSGDIGRVVLFPCGARLLRDPTKHPVFLLLRFAVLCCDVLCFGTMCGYHVLISEAVGWRLLYCP